MNLSPHQREILLRFPPGTRCTHPSYGLVELGLFEKVGFEPRFGGVDIYQMTALGEQQYRELSE